MKSLPLLLDEVRPEDRRDAPPAPRPASTYLPHWGPGQRLIHWLCKRSRTFNTLVAAVEMRRGREELLSLPQYMALCPTGQCNASCGFCSVTINRTGIVKRELPFEHVRQFVRPVARTIRQYGLEGNGEPTLYDRFDDLYRLLTSRGASAYLITNAERLTPEQVDLLLDGRTDSINVSLNAATAETHRQVMRLKHFDRVVENVRRLTAPPENRPDVSVSFVVTAENVHEVPHFLAFAEDELKVDRVLVRPLSEIANEQGAVEDFRTIVPYECDIRDMIDAVEEYLHDVPRRWPDPPPPRPWLVTRLLRGLRKRLRLRLRDRLRALRGWLTGRTAEPYPVPEEGPPPPQPRMPTRFEIAPETFRAYQEDPLDVPVSPRGYEGRLLAPRRRDWVAVERALSVSWHLSRATLDCPARARPGVLWRSAPVPVAHDTRLEFRARCKVAAGSLALAVRAPSGEVLALQEVGKGEHELRLTVATGRHAHLTLEFARGGGALRATIDFERLRTPQRDLQRNFRLPPAQRWEGPLPGVEVSWLDERRVRLCGQALKFLYLLKSYSARCRPGQCYRLGARVEVRRGFLCIGFLNEDFSQWVKLFHFREGVHHTTLEVESAANQRLQCIVFSMTDGPLDADIDWLDSIRTAAPETGQLPEKVATGASGPPSATADTTALLMGEAPRAAATAPAGGPDAPSTGRTDFQSARPDPDGLEIRPTPAGSLRSLSPTNWLSLRAIVRCFTWPVRAALRQVFPWGVTYYCQKPWTDLHNFTVDGRMDVCCIATGSSQERYAWGNLLAQSFQEVWNGERAHEFRRTVNSGRPLPPCQRCPMLHAYQGPWFCPDHTTALFRRMARRWLGWLPGSGRLAAVGERFLRQVVFRGFVTKSERAGRE